MSALDYTCKANGNTIVLKGQLRSGWTDGPHGHYFNGVCEFDWRFGTHCRAQVRLSPRSSLDALEELQWESNDAENHIQWSLRGGFIKVEVAFLFLDSNGQMQASPRLCGTGFKKGRIEHTVHGPAFKANVNIFMNFDREKPNLVAWDREASGASAGLPSLGKRR